MAELESDPEWVARRDERDREFAERTARLRAAEEPLVDDLQRVGLFVESVWDLVNTSEPYPEALPILFKHLERPYPDAVREGIARALAVGEDARFAGETLVRLYRDEKPGTRAKDGLAVAIAGVAGEGLLDEVVSLAGEPAHGTSRVLLLRALERSRKPSARAALGELSSDSGLAKEISLIKRRLRREKS
ncbi:hypothetical protein [Phytoactinopolyspora mesophila]|uniref:HEAT repeat domain-containing protein n=1 Tax=Phytoactinopolyspora mesophila TaxID=2650750 RepID=A0A7K3M118_9ACTN|nr:hypothetical protein [Phytoactinopolyspora mesophila]NDL56995.1 hypothetical protein [Phytoactinopolyspora mesophila]